MAESEGSRRGLHQEWPPLEKSTSPEIKIDIVAIHGLDTEAPKTWVAYEKEGDLNSRPVHWLKDEDMLPSVIPAARIFSYNWNANTFSDAAVDDLLGHANALLDKLHQQRCSGQQHRPIIFIASCFGGLLLSKALNLASASRSEYHDIVASTVGIAFLGTPFRGTPAASATVVRTRLASIVGMTASDRLVRDLDGKSGVFEDIVQTFSNLVHTWNSQIPIRCFYETLPTNVFRAVFHKHIADRLTRPLVVSITFRFHRQV